MSQQLDSANKVEEKQKTLDNPSEDSKTDDGAKADADDGMADDGFKLEEDSEMEIPDFVPE